MFTLREKSTTSVQGLRKSLSTEILLHLAGVSLLVIATQLKIILPFTPVPISFQLIIALMLGVVMGPKRGFTTSLSYVLLITFAVPSLGNGVGGVFFASFGFLAAMPFASLICGYMHQVLNTKSIFFKSIPLFAGTLLVYTLGLPWLALFTGWSNILELGVYPFIALDLARAAIAGTLVLACTHKR